MPQLLEKPLEIDRGKKTKATVLRFDRRQGVILMDRGDILSKSRTPLGLVRDLLVFLRVLAPAAHPPRRAVRKTMRKVSLKGKSP